MAEDEEEYETCPTCEQLIPTNRYLLHLEGLDSASPECPRTDLVEVAERARAAAQRLERDRALYHRPFTRGWA
jgi:hypothetical protein